MRFIVESNAIFGIHKAMLAHKTELHQWKCDFPGCHYQAEHRHRIKDHLISHTNDQQFECDYCHKKYKYKKGLREHFKTQHSDLCPNDSDLRLE